MYQVCLEQGQGLKTSPNCSASLTPNPCPFPQPHGGGGGVLLNPFYINISKDKY